MMAGYKVFKFSITWTIDCCTRYLIVYKCSCLRKISYCIAKVVVLYFKMQIRMLEFLTANFILLKRVKLIELWFLFTFYMLAHW